MEVEGGRTGFTQPPSALQFKTFTLPGRSKEQKTHNESKFTNTNSETRTGMTSENTEEERRSVKTEDEEEIVDIRPTQSFLDRWRALDVDEE
jgi:hypothetical protein